MQRHSQRPTQVRLLQFKELCVANGVERTSASPTAVGHGYCRPLLQVVALQLRTVLARLGDAAHMRAVLQACWSTRWCATARLSCRRAAATGPSAILLASACECPPALLGSWQERSTADHVCQERCWPSGPWHGASHLFMAMVGPALASAWVIYKSQAEWHESPLCSWRHWRRCLRSPAPHRRASRSSTPRGWPGCAASCCTPTLQVSFRPTKLKAHASRALAFPATILLILCCESPLGRGR